MLCCRCAAARVWLSSANNNNVNNFVNINLDGSNNNNNANNSYAVLPGFCIKLYLVRSNVEYRRPRKTRMVLDRQPLGRAEKIDAEGDQDLPRLVVNRHNPADCISRKR